MALNHMNFKERHFASESTDDLVSSQPESPNRRKAIGSICACEAGFAAPQAEIRRRCHACETNHPDYLHIT